MGKLLSALALYKIPIALGAVLMLGLWCLMPTCTICTVRTGPTTRALAEIRSAIVDYRRMNGGSPDSTAALFVFLRVNEPWLCDHLVASGLDSAALEYFPHAGKPGDTLLLYRGIRITL